MHAADERRDAAEVDQLMAQFQAYLGKKQLKSTRQRDLVARTFFGLPGHVNIEQLLAHARQDNPKLGYATVYRTLKLLTECGLAAVRKFGDNQTVYETAGDKDPIEVGEIGLSKHSIDRIGRNPPDVDVDIGVGGSVSKRFDDR